MKKIRTKYTLRSDGYICLSETINGKRKYFYGRSDKEVEQKRDTYIASLEAPVSHILKYIAEEWYSSLEGVVSPYTLKGYKASYERIVDKFGNYEIRDISTRDIIQTLQKYSLQGYSQKSISNAKSVFSCIFNYAILQGYCDRNPCSDLPTIKGKPKVPRQAASESDLQLITEHRSDSLAAALCFTLVYTGLRRGEAIALQQKHIDRENHCIHVEQAVVYENNIEPIIKPPKTAAGIRTVYAPDSVLDLIPKYRSDETFVFFPDGIPSRNITERFLSDYLKSIGVSATPHMLRHSYASILHSAGVDVKDAQYLLGHADLKTTSDIYTHIEERHRAEVSAKLQSFIENQKI